MNRPQTIDANWVLQAKNLSKTYQDGDLRTQVLNQVDFHLNYGEKVAIVGASGSGKSTLLHLLAGLDSPTQGQVLLNQQPFSSLSGSQRGRLRNLNMGFVYQFHHLFSEFDALENVMMPLHVRREPAKSSSQAAQVLLDKVGLGHRLHHKPSELSGGERQRVAIARALVTQPKCILADEPTGNLDHNSADTVFDLLLELNQELKASLLIVTHDTELAAKMDRQMTMLDGQLSTTPSIC